MKDAMIHRANVLDSMADMTETSAKEREIQNQIQHIKKS
jgi:hypothetical protein